MTFKNHIYCLYPLLLFTAVFFGGLILFGGSILSDTQMLMFIVVIYGVFFIPVIFLHIEYSIRDRTVSFQFIDSNEFVYKKGNIETQFKLKDVSEVEYFGETEGFNNLTIQNYSFYIIRLKNKQTLTLTRLTVGNLENFIPERLFRKNRRIFASPLFES